jgi:hypothetical protein
MKCVVYPLMRGDQRGDRRRKSATTNRQKGVTGGVTVPGPEGRVTANAIFIEALIFIIS